MNKRVTIADVAAIAGVHSGTASRALSVKSQHQVNPETVKRVKKAAKQLGYIPNVMARGLRTSSSMTIGVIIPDLTNPLFPPIIRGIESSLSPRGYTALLANTDGRPELEKAAFDSLLERRVDGFILATGTDDHPLLSDAYRNRIKIVMVNRGAGAVPYPLVAGDDGAGVAASIDHLAACGHRHIVHIAGPRNFSTTQVRAEAFEKSCSSREGLTGRIVWVPSLSVEAGETAMNALIESGDRSTTAVVAANDLLALGALRSLRAHGLRCPDDMSVVGFNDMPFAEDFNPALTTVHVPQRDIGSESARLLLEAIERDEQTPVTITMPVSFVARSSTGPAKR